MHRLQIAGLIALAVFVCASSGLADAPRTITVQGRLMNASGGPITPGTYGLMFRIYNAEVGGSTVWLGESWNLNLGADGLWTAHLGGADPIPSSAFSDTARYLEVQVTPPVGPTETLPRFKLNSSPYVMEAARLDGRRGNQYLQTDDSTIVIHAADDVVSFGTNALGYLGIPLAPIFVKRDYAVANARYGVDVRLTNSSSGNIFAVIGKAGDAASSGTGQKVGVDGEAAGTGAGFGISGHASTTGPSYAVYGSVTTSGDGLSDYSGYFEGSKLHVATNAGSATVNAIGNHWRDNSIVAWGKIGGSNGSTSGNEFGVSTVVRNSAGNYTVTLDDAAANAATLLPVATLESDAPPTSAATARLIYIDQVSTTTFNVYVTNGNFVATDNDFTFIVTAR